ncbi:hypothetical protein L3X38_027650 [Prunus dulcis]|uniref:Uncharacterized protein n=1 Tax=Prunus dulcis TaxID=3755 RepID=A0AAD4Z1C3_PRUDU|nr:hypothetical protein L3X38_027650 [Prunus dulcis]
MSIEVGSLDQNCKQMRINLDLLEEKREKAIVRVAAYEQQLTSYYNKKAKIKQFWPGDLVLRKTIITSPRQGSKKMKPNWEGPYMISRPSSPVRSSSPVRPSSPVRSSSSVRALAQVASHPSTGLLRLLQPCGLRRA